MTVAEALDEGRLRLQTASDSPRLDAELLLCGVLALRRGALFARAGDALNPLALGRYRALLQRRAQGEPVAYLLGTQGFWTLDLQVTPAVLVPRPETEGLVEWALQQMPPQARAADLGTGSGAIALALARERPAAELIATDLCAAALAVARANAQRHGIANVAFAQGDWFAAIEGRFDLIVSNPPYVAAGDAHLAALRHEPRKALTDGADGLSCLRTLIAGAAAHLVDGGWLMVEHGYDQGAAVRALFEQAGFAQVQTRRDLCGQERVSAGRRP